MKINKIYQTIISPTKGNCMQAAYATLFNLELKEVPNFVEYGEDWFDELWDFYKTKGYLYSYSITNPNLFDVIGKKSGNIKKINNRFPEIKGIKGINGLYAAVVYSPKYFDITAKTLITHQVLIDKNFNIIHDPNLAYKDLKKYPLADEIGYNGIVSIEFAVKLKTT